MSDFLPSVRHGQFDASPAAEEKHDRECSCMTDNGALSLASILHDTYGCRITCRGGRLADDRHPSHAEAYLDTAAAVLASLDAVGWTLVTVPGPGESVGYSGEGRADTRPRSDLAAASDLLCKYIDQTAEQAATIAALRAALKQISLTPGNRRLVASIAEIALAAATGRRHD